MFSIQLHAVESSSLEYNQFLDKAQNQNNPRNSIATTYQNYKRPPQTKQNIFRTSVSEVLSEDQVKITSKTSSNNKSPLKTKMPFRTSMSSNSSSGDAASTRSDSSKASTLKGVQNMYKKFLATKHKAHPHASSSPCSAAAEHNAAVASYLALR
ncbi:uncharacterized protein P174DRAFT_453614 [Aspergillus novofumigatus IBT 16806]|uniref:Uncharacterized protein n=1 Tax=Aspergillus novofumigatus (strain IBT 16806) TaxID=1392255 RepID=A0A2I1BZ80_ASPN1|nr:uncharacterized protein P174DRAFT_453614 [Aspergillus novofumigatus IBT 16806]PKX90675.1 hypothetical protein P174DRAFT_453614 [Aspergillus novofumigatus IBT 16806]